MSALVHIMSPRGLAASQAPQAEAPQELQAGLSFMFANWTIQ